MTAQPARSSLLSKSLSSPFSVPLTSPLLFPGTVSGCVSNPVRGSVSGTVSYDDAQGGQPVAFVCRWCLLLAHRQCVSPSCDCSCKRREVA